MKTNQKTHQYWAASNRWAAIATVVSVSFAGPSAGNADAGAVKPPTAQAKKIAFAAPDGTVVGTLTINGRQFKLRHVYARKRLAPPLKDVRLYTDSGEPKGELIEVIMTNQPLPEDLLTDILKDKYHGSDKLRGIVLIIEPSEEHLWVTYFLLQSGTVPQSGMTTNRGKPRIENGRITGKIEYKNEDVLDTRTYSVSFKATLKK